MQDTTHIDRGIAAHARWKYRLLDAINTGRSEWTVDGIRSDDGCDFGKWLDSLPLSDRLTEQWKKVKHLHAQFHKAASEVLDLAHHLTRLGKGFQGSFWLPRRGGIGHGEDETRREGGRRVERGGKREERGSEKPR